MEILLLGANGYGVGALKILRGMYEKAVTAYYLHDHPEETENFVDFFWMTQHKLAQAIQETFGKEALASVPLEEVEMNYKEVRDRFMVTDCEKCGTQRLNYTWSKLDFVSMARAAGSIGKLIVPGYYIPMRETHSTPQAILSRLAESETGGLEFLPGAQRDKADDALIMAHNLVLHVLGLQKDHFNLEVLGEPLRKCLEDFQEILQRTGKRSGQTGSQP